jgi:hypothetical protein
MAGPASPRGGGRGEIPLTPQEQLYQLGVALYQAEQALNRAKYPSAAYTKAKTNYQNIKKQFDAVNAQVNTQVASTQKKKNDAEIIRLQGERDKAITH